MAIRDFRPEVTSFATGTFEGKPAQEYNAVIDAYEQLAYEREHLTTMEAIIWRKRQEQHMASLDIMAAIKRGRDSFRADWLKEYGSPQDKGGQHWFDDDGKVMTGE